MTLWGKQAHPLGLCFLVCETGSRTTYLPGGLGYMTGNPVPGQVVNSKLQRLNEYLGFNPGL